MLYPMHLDGERYAGNGETRDVVSPVTGEVIGQIPLGTAEDVDRAVRAAQRAAKVLARMTVFERAELCFNIAEVIRQHRDKLARLLTLEQGKPLRESLAEVDGCVGSFREAGEQIKWMDTKIIPLRDPHKRAFVYRKPRGVYGVITPWNFPIGNACAYYLAPGLAAGNAMVWVPAPSTSAVACEFMQVLEQSALPKGAINLVTGEGRIVGDAVVVHEGVNAIGFTGSTPTGNVIASRAKAKPCLLELGGNGPSIVLADADVDRTAEALARGAFTNAGQVCTSTERVLVHESIADRLVEKLLEQANRVVLGDPFDEKTTMGPVHNQATADKVLEHTRDAVAKGARLLCGGKAQEGRPTGLYIEPTILDYVPADALINTDETFGPVLPIIRFKDESELESLIASSPYRLTAAVFSRDLNKAMMLAEELNFGIVNVNEASNFWDTMIPAGGTAGSATGVGRSGGKWSIEEMSEIRTVVVHFTGEA